ncbi:MAG: chemotaxis protein CheW [Pyrinomonadaceae bacterium]|nr:chemotaxis protein CheW [Pyrinomonadaceae bacterium]
MNTHQQPFFNQSALHKFEELAPDKRREGTLKYAAEIARAISAASAADESSSASGAHDRHLVFRLDNTNYAIPLANMLAIELPLATTALPFVPFWHEGIADLRGDIISIINLRSFFGTNATTRTPSTRVLIMRSLHDEIVVGLIVDAVSKIRRLDSARFVLPESASSVEESQNFMRGIYYSEDASLLVLDAEKMLRALTVGQAEAAVR